MDLWGLRIASLAEDRFGVALAVGVSTGRFVGHGPDAALRVLGLGG